MSCRGRGRRGSLCRLVSSLATLEWRRGVSGPTIARFVEAVLRVAVAREDGNPVSSVLEAHGCVDDESLSSADAQILVKEDYCLLP